MSNQTKLLEQIHQFPMGTAQYVPRAWNPWGSLKDCVGELKSTVGHLRLQANLGYLACRQPIMLLASGMQTSDAAGCVQFMHFLLIASICLPTLWHAATFAYVPHVLYTDCSLAEGWQSLPS